MNIESKQICLLVGSKSVFHECAPGWRKVAVKVVDIFGNDTMTIVEIPVLTHNVSMETYNLQ